jgi:hypothetical protein
LRPQEIESLLKNKFGFHPAQYHNTDHRWFELQLPKLPLILTKVSHQRKDISHNIEGKIARQLRVRKDFFKGMFDCTHNRCEYYQKVKTDPYPPFDFRF